jgi:hypothetical protein
MTTNVVVAYSAATATGSAKLFLTQLSFDFPLIASDWASRTSFKSSPSKGGRRLVTVGKASPSPLASVALQKSASGNIAILRAAPRAR